MALLDDCQLIKSLQLPHYLICFKLRYNNKTYRVDDVDFKTKPSDEVELKSGRISYIDYYQKNYDITIRDHNQPLLIHRSKTKIQGNTVSYLS